MRDAVAAVNCALFGVYSKSSMRTPLGSVIQLCQVSSQP